jgi:cell division protein ZipA
MCKQNRRLKLKILPKPSQSGQRGSFQFNANVETAEIKEFDEESSILDVHLNEQQKYDDESVLSTAETIIALNVYPNPRKALSGDKP